jgi:hypothetical protein
MISCLFLVSDANFQNLFCFLCVYNERSSRLSNYGHQRPEILTDGVKWLPLEMDKVPQLTQNGVPWIPIHTLEEPMGTNGNHYQVNGTYTL